MPRSARWTTTVMLVVLTSACGDPAETPRDGLEIPPPQPDRPLLPSGDIVLGERWRLEPSLALEEPGDLAVDGQGNLYVLDRSSPTQISKFDSTRQFVVRFGEREPEQERIVSARAFSLAPWNTVLFVDQAQNALTTFLTIGTFAQSVLLPGGRGLEVHALPEFGQFYLHKWVPGQRRAVVLHMSAPIDSLSTVYEIRLPEGLSVREEARGVHFNTAVDGAGNLYVGFYDGYPVRVLTSVGETLRVIDLERAPVIKSPAAIDAERSQNLAALRERAPDIQDTLLLMEAAEPDSVEPIIEELAVDRRDRLWVRTNRPDAFQSTPYDVFNEDGDYLARIDVPGHITRTRFAPDGTLLVIDEGFEGGEPAIVAYEVRFGQSP